MYIYSALSKAPVLRKSFVSKFLTVAFVGIHVPLIGLVVYLLFDSTPSVSLLRICTIVLMFTLAATIGTLYVLKELLRPLNAAVISLDNYVTSGDLPNLPTHYEDEVGSLLFHLQNSIEKIDNLVKDKSDMVDILSHDLRAPIGRIMGLCTLIELDDETPPAEYAKDITRESESLIALLEDVLTILNTQHDTGALNLKPLPLKDIVTEAAAYYGKAAADKKVAINIDVNADYKPALEKVLFLQVIKNIISNAVKFSGEGQSIHITTAAADNELRLMIKDEGIGFDPSDKEQIFDRFTKISRKGTRGEKSTGLGLSLSKKIMHRHGGSLNAYSEGAGKGSTFVITLPYDDRSYITKSRDMIANTFSKTGKTISNTIKRITPGDSKTPDDTNDQSTEQ